MSGTPQSFRFVSRGDRVLLRLLAPAGATGLPLLLLGTPDGDASGADAERALATWSRSARVAVIDLPLCGARRSDKLDPRNLPDRLRGDLEDQLACDLGGALDLIDRALGNDGPVAYVGLGLGAELAASFCEAEPRLDGFLLASDSGHALLVSRTPDGDRVETERLASLDPTDGLLERIRRLLGA